MLCPCAGALKESKFEEVMIDTCEKWEYLARLRELEQLLKRDSNTDSWFSRLWFAEG
jgi:hypothetical protein